MHKARLCRRVQSRLVENEKLRPEETAHLAACDACSRFARELGLLRRRMTAALQPPPPRLVQRTRELCLDELAAAKSPEPVRLRERMRDAAWPIVLGILSFLVLLAHVGAPLFGEIAQEVGIQFFWFGLIFLAQSYLVLILSPIVLRRPGLRSSPQIGRSLR